MTLSKELDQMDAFERITTIFKDSNEQWTEFLTLNVRAYCMTNTDADFPLLAPQLVESN